MDTSEIVNSLERELGFAHTLAVAFVRARGKCEYCGTDLLMARQGYANAELDHLLPRSKYNEYIDDTRNQVLSCRTCNGIKRNIDLLRPDESKDEMLAAHRDDLIDRARAYIADKMAMYDDDWRKATKLMQKLWWLK